MRGLREAKGLTQAGLAEAAGIRKGTLSGYESGGALPRLAVLERILDATGTDLLRFAVVLRAEQVRAGTEEASGPLGRDVVGAEGVAALIEGMERLIQFVFHCVLGPPPSGGRGGPEVGDGGGG